MILTPGPSQPFSDLAPDACKDASWPRAAVVIPAFNEAGRITDVLHAIVGAHLVDEVIVVTDGCQDSTASEARGFAALVERGEIADAARQGEERIAVRVLELHENIGKGGAMMYGAHRTEAEIVLFFDADLIGLCAHHVDDLLRPCLAPESRADMTLGLFGEARGGIFGWWLGICHRNVAALTGQRAMRRDVFLAVPGLTRSRFGVEIAITRYVKHSWKLKVAHVYMHQVTHPCKEEKIGLFRGFKHRSAMYCEIAGYIAYDSVRQGASARHRAERSEMRERFGGRL